MISSYLDSAKRLEAYLTTEGLPLEPEGIRAFLITERERTTPASAAKHYRKGDSGIRVMVKRRGMEASVQNCYPHRFRHTFADSWLAAGGNVDDLMNVADWKTIAMPCATPRDETSPTRPKLTNVFPPVIGSNGLFVPKQRDRRSGLLKPVNDL
jgi:hypothetical protein